MNKMRNYAALLLLCLASNVLAQPGKWDREKYPDAMQAFRFEPVTENSAEDPA